MLLQTTSLLKQTGRSWTMPTGDGSNKRRSILPSLSWKQASELEISLDGEDDFIRSYSTFDEITGHAKLKFERDTCIDDLLISFQGQTNTWVDKIATSSPSMGKSTGKHVFLRVQQPIDQSCLPESNKALAGVEYTIPFKFVVPDRILDFTCNHRIEREDIRLHHLELPPSIGDPMLSGHGSVLMDDLAPEMSKISYSIRIAVLKAPINHRKPELVQQFKGVRIVPAREEMPPVTLDVTPIDGTTKYRLRKEKNVRKGIFKLGKKQGRLTAESTQPPSLRLPHPSRYGDEPIATTTTIQLRYDPASPDEQPPSLASIASKLKVWTFFGAAPWTYMPAPDTYDSWSTLHSQYPVSVDLSTLNLSNVEWSKHEPGASAAVSRSNSVARSSARDGHRRKSTTTTDAIERSNSNETRTSCSSDADSLSDRSSASVHSGATSISTSAASSTLINDTSICSPSTSYDASLPYYTTSIILPIALPTSPSQAQQSSRSQPPAFSRSNSVPNPATGGIQTSSSSSNRHLSSATTTSTASSAAPSRRPSKPTSSSSSKCPIFLPTFHSCLISRVYSLELTVNATAAPNLNLRLPIQLAMPCTNPRPSHAATAHTLPPHPLARFTNPNPFSPTDRHHDGETESDLPEEDEALALALESRPHAHLHLHTNQHRHSIASPYPSRNRMSASELDDVPEYEDTYQVIGREGGGNAGDADASTGRLLRAGVEARARAALGYGVEHGEGEGEGEGQSEVGRELPTDAPPDYDSLSGFGRRQGPAPATRAAPSASTPASGSSAGRNASAGGSSSVGDGRRNSIRRKFSLIP